MYSLTVSLTAVWHTVHLVSKLAQPWQHTRCPQGINTTPMSASSQILHLFCALSRLFSISTSHACRSTQMPSTVHHHCHWFVFMCLTTSLKLLTITERVLQQSNTKQCEEYQFWHHLVSLANLCSFSALTWSTGNRKGIQQPRTGATDSQRFQKRTKKQLNGWINGWSDG